MTLETRIGEVLDSLAPFEQISVSELAKKVCAPTDTEFRQALRMISETGLTTPVQRGKVMRNMFDLDDINKFLSSLRNAKLCVEVHNSVTCIVVHVTDQHSFVIEFDSDQEVIDFSNQLISNALNEIGKQLEITP